jgi:hypothetical protein
VTANAPHFLARFFRYFFALCINSFVIVAQIGYSTSIESQAAEKRLSGSDLSATGGSQETALTSFHIMICPPDITVCPDRGSTTDTNVTGFPTIFSCLPPDQLHIEYSDGSPDFKGTFARTWTVIDFLCGLTDQCIQYITVPTAFGGTPTATFSADGHLLTLHAMDPEEVMKDAQWSLSFNGLQEGNGVHFVDSTTVEIDLDVRPLLPGPVNANYSIPNRCTAPTTGPPLYSLSRAVPATANFTPGIGSHSFTFTCGTQVTYGPSSGTYYFFANEPGVAHITANSQTARLAALEPGTSLSHVNALTCGTQSLRFAVNAFTTYIVIVEATEKLALTGAIVDPSLIIALSGALAFDTVAIGSHTTRSFIINNNGNLPLNVTSIAYPPGYSGDWAGGPVQAGTAQNVTVSFSPSVAGSYNGSIMVNSDATEGDHAIAVTGNAISTKVLTVNGDLAFGPVEIGSSKILSYTILNSGNTAVTVSSIQYPSAFSGNWSGSIAPGAFQTIAVTFTPGAAISHDGTVTINSDATSVTAINISGTGLLPPLTIPPPSLGALNLPVSLDFGSVTAGSSVTRSFRITNTNAFAVTVLGVKYPQNCKGDWTGGALESGGSRIVNVQFTPMQPMIFVDSIVVTSDAPQTLSSTTVIANVIEAVKAVIKLNGNLAFGNIPVGTSKSGTLQIENSGNSVLTVTSISYPEDVTADFNTGPMQIPPHGTGTVNVSFSPKRAGNYAGNIEVKSDALEGGNTFSIQGTAFIVSFVTTDLRRPANGLFELTVSVPAGKKLILEASADFRFWRTVATRSTFGGEVTLLDPVSNSTRAQYYRFRLE